MELNRDPYAEFRADDALLASGCGLPGVHCFELRGGELEREPEAGVFPALVSLSPNVVYPGVCCSSADVKRALEGIAEGRRMPPGGAKSCVLTEYIVPRKRVMLFKGPPSEGGGAAVDVFELFCLGSRVDMALPPGPGTLGFLEGASRGFGPGSYTFTQDYSGGRWYLTTFGEPHPLEGLEGLGERGESMVRGFCFLRAYLPGRGGGAESFTHGEDASMRITGISDGLERAVHFVREGESAVSDGCNLALAWSRSLNPNDAKRELADVLEQLHFDGIATNREFLLAYLRGTGDSGRRIHPGVNRFWGLTNAARGDVELIEVLEPGVQSTVQCRPGRLGYWMVGIPPSGPMDALHASEANGLLGNSEGAALIEITAGSFAFRALGAAVFASAGMDCRVERNSRMVRSAVFTVCRGDEVRIRPEGIGGYRRYLAVRGGFRLKEYLGNASCFAMGGMGGWGGRILRKGDRLSWNSESDAGLKGQEKGQEKGEEEAGRVLSWGVSGRLPVRKGGAASRSPHIARGRAWVLRIFWGPQGDAAYFRPEYLKTFTDALWRVDHNSDRSGIRLIGPKPGWARNDGGEAGLHPSNIHDNAYAVGSIDFTGDMPIILGPDGPSLGGFLCPGVVADGELWKLGQLRPGDTLRFDAEGIDYGLPEILLVNDAAKRRAGILAEGVSGDDTPWMIRASGDSNLLVEVGPEQLDIELRFMVQHLFEFIRGERIPGILDLTPGIRTLQIHFDAARAPVSSLVQGVRDYLNAYTARDDAVLTKRSIYLPLSWDDSSTRRAVEIYMRSVNPKAPWCPDNIEFIRRINGLESRDEVRDIVFSARYLVLGLGDVYKGAPVAVPVDPRRRLVTTKYNPARTWTPENAVGIGGSYLCIYGMEGPGGYQFVGRTLQVWNSFQKTREFERPWLLRFFDTIRFFPVDEQELAEMREAFPRGGCSPRIEHDSFNLAEHREFLRANADSIEGFRRRRRAAYEAERRAWDAAEDAAETEG